MKNGLIYFSVIIILFGCKKDNEIVHTIPKSNSLVFKDLHQAWEEKDSSEVNRWILSLSDSNLCEVDFYYRLSDLSGVTRFCYGNADLTEDYYWTIPPKIRSIPVVRFSKLVRL